MFVANDSKSSSVISVKKQELVDAITKNYKEHRSIFEQAQNGYRAAVIAELDKMLADARVRMAHGLPLGLDRLRALGDSVVPQCAEVVGRIIRHDLGLAN